MQSPSIVRFSVVLKKKLCTYSFFWFCNDAILLQITLVYVCCIKKKLLKLFV